MSTEIILGISSMFMTLLATIAGVAYAFSLGKKNEERLKWRGDMEIRMSKAEDKLQGLALDMKDMASREAMEAAIEKVSGEIKDLGSTMALNVQNVQNAVLNALAARLKP